MRGCGATHYLAHANGFPSPLLSHLSDAMDALRRAPLPPDAVQLPTSFELLGGGGGPGGVVSPRLSPRLAEGGMAAAAGGNGGGGGMVEAGALPVQPGELQRSPSLDDLLSKVQRIDASQVRCVRCGQGFVVAPPAVCGPLASGGLHLSLACRSGGGMQFMPASGANLTLRFASNLAGHSPCQDRGGCLWGGVAGALLHVRQRGGQVDQAHQGGRAVWSGMRTSGLGSCAAWAGLLGKALQLGPERISRVALAAPASAVPAASAAAAAAQPASRSLPSI